MAAAGAGSCGRFVKASDHFTKIDRRFAGVSACVWLICYKNRAFWGCEQLATAKARPLLASSQSLLRGESTDVQKGSLGSGVVCGALKN
jgi:hypothetical protein